MKTFFFKLLPFILCVLFVSCEDSNEFDELETKLSESESILTRNAADDYSWDWTDPDSYSHAYIIGKGAVPISSPFTTFTSASKPLSYIINGKDYLPEQGWCLLDKVFGTPNQYAETTYPYFILYNKYRGIVRVYALNVSGFQHTRAIVTVGWSSSNKNALFALSGEYAEAQNEYLRNNVNNKVVNYVDDYYANGWFVTDFIVAFDHKTNEKNDYAIEFKIYSADEANLNLGGVFKFETKTATLSEQGTNNINEYSVLSTTGKIMNNISDSKALSDLHNSIKSATDKKNFLGKEELEKKQGEFDDFFNFVKDASSIAKNASGVVSFVTGLFNSFIGKSTSISTVKIMPTISEGSITLNGTINTKSNAARYSLQLPGTNHKYADGSQNVDGLPIYDKPLGVYCLEEQPRIQRKAYVQSYSHEIDDETKYHPYTMTSYKVVGDIKIAVNKDAGLEYIGGTAQLIDYGSFDKFDDEGAEDVCDALEDGNLIQMRADSVKIYGTRPMPIEKFKGTAFISADANVNQEAYLKLTLVFKPTDANAEQTPVIMSHTYKISNIEDLGLDGNKWHTSHKRPKNGSPFKMTKEQTIDGSGTDVAGNALKLAYY